MAPTRMTGQQIKDATVATADLIDANVTFAKIQNVSALRVVGKKAPTAGVPEEISASDLLDFLSSTQGRLLYRDTSTWQALAVGNNGEVLVTQGAGANPAWVNKAATQAEMEAGSTTLTYTTPGRQQYHPSAAKVWSEFNGTGTIAERASYNSAGITDNGVGQYRVNIATDFSSANYAPFVSCDNRNAVYAAYCGLDFDDPPAAGTCGIRIYSNTTSALDPTYVSFVAFGDQA